MRSYRGARFITGAATTARARPDTGGFVASFDGTCGGCGLRYRVGDRIKSPGKGRGAYHLACKLFASPPSSEREAQRAEVKDAIRSWNTIR